MAASKSEHLFRACYATGQIWENRAIKPVVGTTMSHRKSGSVLFGASQLEHPRAGRVHGAEDRFHGGAGGSAAQAPAEQWTLSLAI